MVYLTEYAAVGLSKCMLVTIQKANWLSKKRALLFHDDGNFMSAGKLFCVWFSSWYADSQGCYEMKDTVS
jgi:hypothetical protein